MKKKKALFPKLERGAYTARLGFYDESRGERYFDTEWSINTGDFDVAAGVWTKLGQPGRNNFNITGTVDYRGFIRYANADFELAQLAKALTAGTRLTVQPRKWNMRGAKYLPAAEITVTKATPFLSEQHGRTLFVAVEFE